MARETGFVARKSKLQGFSFMFGLMFSYINGKHFSLSDMSGFLLSKFGIDISKQSLHSRFTDKASEFMKMCLDEILKKKLSINPSTNQLLSKFNRIRIKDSTKFNLLSAFSEKYKGYGGVLHNSSSMISIQHEYDFKSCKRPV